MVENKKKILLVNEDSINKNNATGITLRALFGGLRNVIIREVFFNKKNIIESDIVQKEYYSNNIVKKISTSKFARNTNNKLKEESNFSKKEFINIKQSIRKLLVYFVDLFPPKLTKDDYLDLIQYNPDVIYTLGGNISSLKLSYRLAKKLNKKIIIHFMDNWAFNLQWESNFGSKCYKKIQTKWLKKCLQYSDEIIVISESMGTYYYNKFKLPFTVLMNSVEINNINIKQFETNMNTITYAGGLHLNRWIEIKEIAQMINLLKLDYKINIFTNKISRERFEREFINLPVRFYNYVDHRKINEIYEKSDILLHVESKSNENSEFNKFSISTKIPEYLSSGKPILFYGPKNLYLYNYLLENDVAFTASNYCELKEIFTNLKDITKIEKKVTNAKKLAYLNHNLNINLKKLESIIMNY